MKTIVLAVLLTVVAAGPLPGNVLVQPGREQLFYPLPLEYPIGPGYFAPQQPLTIPFVAPVADKQQIDAGQIKVLLAVPAVVPPGTSISVTVNVNSTPGAGTVVSVSNPVVSSSPNTAGNDAIIVDAKPGGPVTVEGIQFPEEFDNREPPILGAGLPFDNPKDSDLLIALQQEAIKQQLAAVKKTA